jgi:hypothetical protein
VFDVEICPAAAAVKVNCAAVQAGSVVETAPLAERWLAPAGDNFGVAAAVQLGIFAEAS